MKHRAALSAVAELSELSSGSVSESVTHTGAASAQSMLQRMAVCNRKPAAVQSERMSMLRNGSVQSEKQTILVIR